MHGLEEFLADLVKSAVGRKAKRVTPFYWRNGNAAAASIDYLNMNVDTGSIAITSENTLYYGTINGCTEVKDTSGSYVRVYDTHGSSIIYRLDADVMGSGYTGIKVLPYEWTSALFGGISVNWDAGDEETTLQFVGYQIEI